MKRRPASASAKHRPGPASRAANPHHGNRLPVAATVLSFVALLGLWQFRLAAEPSQAGAISPVAVALDAGDESARDAAGPGGLGGLAHRRLREGTQLTNCLGHFRQTGDVVSFVDEGGRDIGGLPNLNLERITRMLKAVDEPESIWWSVSGTITEFSGRNYVLITRAVYKASTPPPSPESIAPEPGLAP